MNRYRCCPSANRSKSCCPMMIHHYHYRCRLLPKRKMRIHRYYFLQTNRHHPTKNHSTNGRHRNSLPNYRHWTIHHHRWTMIHHRHRHGGARIVVHNDVA
jgi:hypothetical protein